MSVHIATCTRHRFNTPLSYIRACVSAEKKTASDTSDNLVAAKNSPFFSFTLTSTQDTYNLNSWLSPANAPTAIPLRPPRSNDLCHHPNMQVSKSRIGVLSREFRTLLDDSQSLQIRQGRKQRARDKIPTVEACRPAPKKVEWGETTRIKAWEGGVSL